MGRFSVKGLKLNEERLGNLTRPFRGALPIGEDFLQTKAAFYRKKSLPLWGRLAQPDGLTDEVSRLLKEVR